MRLKTVHIVVVVLVFIGAILAYESFSSDIAPYLSVSNITNDSSVHVGKNVKVLGRVANVSSGRSKEGYNFELNDGKATIAVTYTGSLSQSLKKGQEVGVIGVQDTPDHVTASQLDIKCASKYE